ncbi:hypothetical protein, partial [Lacrimispora sp.]|uniref:hypothetical protein n=1 Tax=Lacrimispora sp. TaxID=2719234 RepID=UPI0028AD8E8C
FCCTAPRKASFSILALLSGREKEWTKGERVVCKNLSANAVTGWKKAIKNRNHPHGFDKF